MRRKTILLLAGLGLLGGALLLGLKSYQLDLIHYVIVNAMLEKAPEESASEIRAVFEQALQRAEAEDKEEVYLKKLLALSQRLEKVQKLKPENVGKMLDEVRAFDQPVIDPDAVER